MFTPVSQRASQMASRLACKNVGRRRRRGFTLIELMLVMVIIAILAAIIIPKFAGRSEQARVTRVIADLATLKQGLQAFEIDNGRYPTQDEGLQALVTNPGNLPDWHAYLDKLPMDPWGHPYQYHCPGQNGQDFDVYSLGPSGQDGAADNIYPK
jgi:general secretion pathway protein G